MFVGLCLLVCVCWSVLANRMFTLETMVPKIKSCQFGVIYSMLENAGKKISSRKSGKELFLYILKKLNFILRNKFNNNTHYNQVKMINNLVNFCKPLKRKMFGVSILKLKSKIQFNQSDTIFSNATQYICDLQCVVCMYNKHC